MEPNSRKNDSRFNLEKIKLDLGTYEVQLYFHNQKDPCLVHFDKPARRFYFSLIALIVIEMKNLDRPDFIFIRKFEKTLKLLDNSLAGTNASKTEKGMWDKVRKAWRYTLPDLEAGALFKILDRSLISPYEKGGKYRYVCSDEECDVWANLFGYDENSPWRLKFAVDSVFVNLKDVSVTFGERQDNSAWQEFLKTLSINSMEDTREKSSASRWKKKMALTLIIISLVVAVTSMIWNFSNRPVSPLAISELSDKLSIAVLPFTNIGGDPEQEYFSDGFTDDLITDLSKISDLFVIARNSTFTYKGKPTKVQQISEDLGVRYVLEGSVRKVGAEIRINAQLVDAITGHHLWAQRYDSAIKDIIDLQDGIIKKILTALKVKLTMGEQVRVFARNTDNFEAYLIFLQAVHNLRKTHQEGNILARTLCYKTIDLDPEFADPYRVLAWTHLSDVWFGWSKSPEESFQKAVELADKSLSLDGNNPNTIATMGQISLLKRQHEKAIAEGEKSITLDPNGANNYMLLATTLRFSGRAPEAVPLIKKAIRLEPHTPANFYYQLGMAYNFTGQYDNAIAVLKKALKRTPDHLLSLIGLTVAYSLADKMTEARATAAELLRVDPKFSVNYMEKKSAI